jgi:PAS domain S-box-containing protein
VEGQPESAVVFSLDITQRRDAEATIRASEARFRTLADTVPQIIWTNHPNGNANYFNKRWFDYCGLSYEECAGPGWQVLVHPDDAATSISRWQSALASGEAFNVEYRLRRADGAYRWHIGRNVPLRNAENRVSGWFGTATDIEDLKQAERRQRESEERYRLLVEGARDYAMFLMDPQRRITHWSAGAERIFGFTREEAIGLSGDVIFTPEDVEAGAPEQEAQTAVTEGRAADVRWHLRKDGSGFWADGVNTALKDESGTLRGFAKITRDATKEREAEEELRRAHDDLEVRVEERTMKLQKEVARRKEWETQRTHLIQRIVQVQEAERGRISRELHDNLSQHATAIMLSLHMLKDSQKPSAEEQHDNAEQWVRLQHQMEELVNMAHRLAWELRPAELDNIGLDAALRQYVKDWERNGIAVDFVSRIPGEQQVKKETGITSDAETALYRVVQEALTNVLRHAGASQVAVVLERGTKFVTVIIEDNGRGFEIEAASLSIRLGLRGMQERMELVGGTLEIESSPGEGTTVYARVPTTVPSS